MMDLDHRLAAALLLVALAVGPVWADDAASPAQRVRLTVPSLQEKAIVGAAGRGRRRVASNQRPGRKEAPETVVVSRSSVTQFEVSRGKSWKACGRASAASWAWAPGR